MNSLSDFINQINDSMKHCQQLQSHQHLATTQEMAIEKTRLLQSLQAQQNATNSIYGVNTTGGAFGSGGTTGGTWPYNGGIPSTYQSVPPTPIPAFPALPTPTGTKIPIQFTDAFGHVNTIMVDSAYIGILNFISYAHRDSRAGVNKISTMPSMDDGEFSEEELERAQIIIDELGAKPKAEANV